MDLTFFQIKTTILGINDYIQSLNFGIFFLVSVAAIAFSSYVFYSILVDKTFRKKSKLEKILFASAVAISLVFILQIILAGDIRPNLSAEKIARLFGESLCNGRTEEITERINRVLTDGYHDRFFTDWGEKSKEFTDIQSSADEFDLIEYHYKNLNMNDSERCTVIIQTTKILNIAEAEDADDILQSDYNFIIGLTKVSIPSRFLGNYMRWKISSFSYKKSMPYTMKEWFERFKQP